MLCCAAGRGAAARVPGGRTTRPAVSVPCLRTPPAASGTSERARAHAWHRSCRWVPIGRRQSRSARTEPVHELLLTAPRVDRVRCSQAGWIHAKNTCSVAFSVEHVSGNGTYCVARDGRVVVEGGCILCRGRAAPDDVGRVAHVPARQGHIHRRWWHPGQGQRGEEGASAPHPCGCRLSCRTRSASRASMR